MIKKKLLGILALYMIVSSTIPLDVVHGAVHGEEGVTTVIVDEGRTPNQTKSASIPTKTYLINQSVNTGNVWLNRNSTYGYTINVSGGNITWEEYDAYKYSQSASSSLTSKDRNFPSSVSSSSGGYSGTISQSGSPYVISGDFFPEERKFVSMQSSPSYNSGGFSGSLEKYASSGVHIPSEGVYVSAGTCQNSLTYKYNSKGENAGTVGDYNNNRCPSYRTYSDSRVSGTLYGSGGPNRPCQQTGAPNATCTENWTVTYAGTLYTKEVDTRVWHYRGTVVKPELDTRTWKQDYRGTIYMPGTWTRWKYSVGLHYRYDLEPPKILLRASKTTPTNQDVQIYTTITDGDTGITSATFEGSTTTGKRGNLTVKDGMVNVEDNGVVTVTAVDGVGNTSVEKIEVKNIDRTEPVIVVEGDFHTWTRGNVPLKVYLSPKQGYKEIAHFKYKEGKHSLSSFQEGRSGSNLQNNSYVATDNGYITFYVRDTADNETINVVRVTNIDRVKPQLKPEWDKTLTSEKVIVRTNAIDYESGVKVLKWMPGRQTDETVKTKGNGTFGGTFDVHENGDYTIYVEDVAGNTNSTTITVNTISHEKADKPTFKEIPGDKETKLDIIYDSRWEKKYYRVSTGPDKGKWLTYTGRLTFKESTIVEAYSETDYGVKSEIGTHYVGVKGEETDENPTDVGEDPNLEYPDHRIPTQQGELEDLGVQNGQRNYGIKMYSDLMMLSKHTGYVGSYGYAKDVKDSYVKGTTKPSLASIMGKSKDKITKDFEDYYGNKYVDTLLHESSPTVSKLERFYVPLDTIDPLVKETEYKNIFSISGVGLSDSRVEFEQRFEFDKYVLGDGAEDVLLYEHRETKLLSDEVDPKQVNTVVIKNEDVKKLHELAKERGDDTKIHVLRVRDREFINIVRDILGLN